MKIYALKTRKQKWLRKNNLIRKHQIKHIIENKTIQQIKELVKAPKEKVMVEAIVIHAEIKGVMDDATLIVYGEKRNKLF